MAKWIENASAIPAGPGDRAIGLKQIDMIAAHDTSTRLDEITQPTLVLCGDNNHCTPMPLSEELTRGIPGAELVVFQDAGELIEIEQEQRYFEVVSSFIGRHSEAF
ncbi:alpha/beta fold hydrolase [Catenulispora pinisilvae]|uniref:alpha/beta fold hydrolase n=1 Tax=Catenulispora pinisilvae TaxID=2705253 RepID=UPI0018920543|nr:alpha/beta fold hydrolase [Catenulispora pinisilvae]